jgi:GT2 family glycosyltransferase
MNSEPLIACVIVNWNGWRDTVACLGSLRSLEYSNLFTVVVDNGSSDASICRIREAYPEVCLIENGRNAGFAGGNNAGIREAMCHNAEYIWLLNNDTEPAPGVLREMVSMAEADPELGAVGSVLFYSSAPQTVQAWGGGWINLWYGHSRHATDPPKPSDKLDYLTAASMLVRRKVFEQVGLMDDRFFLYWEDAELCYRLRRGGWKLGVAARGTVLHKVNASASKNRGGAERYFTTSGIRFLLEYSATPVLSAALFLSLRILNRAVHGRINGIREVWRGVEDYRLRDRGAALPLR